MNDSITIEKGDGNAESFTGGKAFVDAVAKAGSKEKLRRILNKGRIAQFSEEDLEEAYRNLALSQHWDTIQELFEEKDYDSCCQKLAAYGITTSREHFDLINDVIATASDAELIHEILHNTDMDATLDTLHRHGYHATTAEFLQLVHENAVHLYEDALLTEEDLAELSGQTFYERCRKSINLMFALSTIAGLSLGVSGVADPALLIAIAGGVSLMFGKDGAAQ
ncbi:MAG: hypothetical protein LUD82_09580 [Clostridiales bacterium]|nr:hypothetical protein [Clostridiales bacterium]